MLGPSATSGGTLALARVQAMVSDCLAMPEGRRRLADIRGLTSVLSESASPPGTRDPFAGISRPLGGKVCYFLIFRFTLRKFYFFVNFLAFGGRNVGQTKLPFAVRDNVATPTLYTGHPLGRLGGYFPPGGAIGHNV